MPQRDLMQDLLEQLDFLRSSATGFDEGRQHEAKRMAVTLRVLLYDGGRGTSLLTQMGVRDALDWVASGSGVHPENLLPTASLTVRRSGLVDGERYVTYLPVEESTMLADIWPGEMVQFDEWWSRPVIRDLEDRRYSRGDLILLLANRDGGAHVGRLSSTEEALHSGKHLGWVIAVDGDDPGVPLELSPIPASMRTIATEVLFSIRSQAALVAAARTN